MLSVLIYATSDLFSWPYLNGSKLNLALMTQRTKYQICSWQAVKVKKNGQREKENFLCVYLSHDVWWAWLDAWQTTTCVDQAQVRTCFIFTALYDDRFTAHCVVKLHFRLHYLFTSVWLSSFFCGKKQLRYSKDSAVELMERLFSKDVLLNFKIIKSTLCPKMLNTSYPVVFITDGSWLM